MKYLILLRHAKSVSLLDEMSDFKRSLNEKGRHDAAKVAKAFKKLDIAPDLFLCSKAHRTVETLELFKPYLPDDAKVVYLKELYHASASTLFDLVSENSAHKCIMIVGHNFGISDFANHMSEEGAGEMITCGLYILKFKDDFAFNKGKIVHYLSPKNI